jgi:hypothetical protein
MSLDKSVLTSVKISIIFSHLLNIEIMALRKTLDSHDIFVNALHVVTENKKTNTYSVIGSNNFLALLKHKSSIDKKFRELCRMNPEFDDYRLNLGDDWIVSLTYGNKFLHIRKICDSAAKGVKLSILDWTMLKNHLPEIYKQQPDIALCIESTTLADPEVRAKKRKLSD